MSRLYTGTGWVCPSQYSTRVPSSVFAEAFSRAGNVTRHSSISHLQLGSTHAKVGDRHCSPCLLLSSGVMSEVEQVQLVADIRMVQFGVIALACWVVHDAILAFPQEWEHVWTRRITFPRAMFALSKIMGIGILSTTVYLITRPLLDTGYVMRSINVCAVKQWAS